jgi:hypothetical protein
MILRFISSCGSASNGPALAHSGKKRLPEIWKVATRRFALPNWLRTSFVSAIVVGVTKGNGLFR